MPQRDSTVVAKARAAGAVILGKTNMTEFSNLMTSGMPNGYSSLGGQVLNPYDIDASPNGASSGTAASAAAGLAAITIGTETFAGSIVSPGRGAGDVGLRPTVGLVSRTGILPASASQDTAGPITRTVADAAAELQAIAGKDPEDPATDSAPATVPNYLAALKPDRAQRQADRRHRQRQRQLPGGDRRDPVARRDDGDDPDPEPVAELPGHPRVGVQARPQRLPRPPARERADEVARRTSSPSTPRTPTRR